MTKVEVLGQQSVSKAREIRGRMHPGRGNEKAVKPSDLLLD
jgi:hypothetical protein